MATDPRHLDDVDAVRAQLVAFRDECVESAKRRIDGVISEHIAGLAARAGLAKSLESYAEKAAVFLVQDFQLAHDDRLDGFRIATANQHPVFDGYPQARATASYGAEPGRALPKGRYRAFFVVIPVEEKKGEKTP